ncbi:hypothetical protein [Actinoplanes sp. NPDC048796]|uniref:hypothetical protein n=1 Tax=unclassified Actinoplanes TaxID=2626549 RepID=UPI0033EB607E
MVAADHASPLEPVLGPPLAVVAADQASPVLSAFVAAVQAWPGVFLAFAERVAEDHVWSALPGRAVLEAGRAEGRRRSPVIAEKARIRWATPVARSPAPLARRAAAIGLGSRVAAIALHTGQTQHSGLPVAQ